MRTYAHVLVLLQYFLVGVISKYFSLCKNFHSKAGMGVNSDMGVISRERVRYIHCNEPYIIVNRVPKPLVTWFLQANTLSKTLTKLNAVISLTLSTGLYKACCEPTYSPCNALQADQLMLSKSVGPQHYQIDKKDLTGTVHAWVK